MISYRQRRWRGSYVVDGAGRRKPAVRPTHAPATKAVISEYPQPVTSRLLGLVVAHSCVDMPHLARVTDIRSFQDRPAPVVATGYRRIEYPNREPTSVG